MKFEALGREGNIGSLSIKNRIVLPALNNNFTHNGYMTEESIDFYVSKARGGAGLVIVEATSVDYPRSRSVLNPAIDHEKYISGFQRIADGCHQYGAKVFVQLSHVGRQSRRSTTGMDPVAPSPIASNSPLYPDTPKVLEKEDITGIVDKFAAAAVIARKSGLDGVEIIMGHGYLANNFLSPVSNQRTDEYGGLKGGIKFCCDIISGIKAACGNEYPVICRINGDDYIKEGGNSIVEAQLIAQELEKAGADAINVSAGMRDSQLSFNDHTSGQPRGAWIHLAERIKRGIGIPVIIVKRFNPELAEVTLERGQADFIAFGKQFICDPDFGSKVLNGHLEDIIPCTSCCQGCYDELWMKKPITCMVNPSVGKKMTYLAERGKKKGSKTILVVGGGPAGCEASLELARLGHKVTMVEKETVLGGKYWYCTHTKAKKEVEDVFRYFAYALEKAGVDVRLRKAFSREMLDELKPDILIDATGAEFKMPDIEGINLPSVMTPTEALDGSKELGEYVVVVACSYNCTWTCRKISEDIPDDIVGMKTSESHACSAGHAAADVAEELANQGKKVCIITGRDEFVPGMGFTNRGNMLKRYFQKNITVSTGLKVKKILQDGLVCEKEGMEFKVCADSIVMSTGMKSSSYIKKQAENFGGVFYQIGDCGTIGNALKAFHGAYELSGMI
ncbi:NAD(P)/FAD-dependent oxidoreductase [Lachnoclostridium pacaense]|uniref:oxidoreductase n=1 Tax=Enterocloster hominis (ex Hitch et al. 2024) TaxID=1917870 RepID=UPI001D126761|nr:FAD-dependent oxidoreductase [Lachnoclostridium pacaense]MCC2878147.1 NAD(P)/FAD-dependent oxidoreductase [Lachnoclostridium pacaense]